MQRKTLSDSGYFINEIVANAFSFGFDRSRGIKNNRLSKMHAFKLGRQIERNKGKRLSGSGVVELGDIHKFVMEAIDNVVVFFVAFGEDNHLRPVFQLGNTVLEGKERSFVVINGDGVGVFKNKSGRESYNMR